MLQVTIRRNFFHRKALILYCNSKYVLIVGKKLMLPSCHSGQAETLCFLSYFHLLLYARKQERRVEPHFIFRTSTKLNCMKNSTTENRHRRRFPLLFFFANAFLSSKENILHVLCILYNLGLYIGGDYIGYTYGGHAKGFFSRFVFSWVANGLFLAYAQYLNFPRRRRWLNISPPEMNSRTMYRLLLS